jgi:hypothetical protein
MIMRGIIKEAFERDAKHCPMNKCIFVWGCDLTKEKAWKRLEWLVANLFANRGSVAHRARQSRARHAYRYRGA